MDTDIESGTSTSPACAPGAIPAEERPAHFTLISHLFGTAVLEKQVLPAGYAFRFAPDAFDQLARFVANERRCCPFLNLAIEVSPEGGPVWLRLTGPAGTRELLDAELPKWRSWGGTRTPPRSSSSASGTGPIWS